MIHRCDASSFVELAQQLPVLDVRSPGEYEQGHVPGAISFPLFTDDERAEVGTLYKQVGKDAAVARGLALVEPRMAEMYQQGISSAREGQVLVHCWRGGKRSESVAWLLSLSGLKVHLLEGGYKKFRQWVLAQFEKTRSISIIGGRTGSGKTEVLHALRQIGEATIDLEQLADHKGSAFGRLGASRQVTQAQFENDLAFDLWKNENRHLWIEDESRGIGRLVIPEPLWLQMRNTTVYFLDLTREERTRILRRIYGDFPLSEIENSIHKVTEKLGGLRTREALDALHAREDDKLIAILLDYYDKSYSHGLSKRDPKTIRKVQVDHFDAGEIARRLVELAASIQ